MNSNRIKETAMDAEVAYEMLLAEEDLILQAQMLIQSTIDDRDMSQKQLADLLGVSPSYVSQMLGDSARNLTLRTVARVLHVLGKRSVLQLALADGSIDQCELESNAQDCTAKAREIAACFDSDVWAGYVGVFVNENSAPTKENKPRRRTRASSSHETPEYAMAA